MLHSQLFTAIELYVNFDWIPRTATTPPPVLESLMQQHHVLILRL